MGGGIRARALLSALEDARYLRAITLEQAAAVVVMQPMAGVRV